jgi:SanA protein
MRKTKRILIISIILITLPVMFVFFSNYAVIKTTHSQIYSNINEIPVNDIGLVLGTSKYTVGGINLYYKYRIEAAAELYFSGKIKHTILGYHLSL